MDRSLDPVARRLRVAMYSHDTMGLGHMRRNLLLAQTLASEPTGADVLLVAGSSEINALRLPQGVDCLSLPALNKCQHGGYSPRRLAIPLSDLTRIRGETIRTAVQAFAPDLFIVDNIPRGANRELNATLAMLAEDPLAHCVLGLRDVLDDAPTVKQQWAAARNDEAIASFYDAVWIYGDRQVFDPITAYDWSPQIAEKVSFTGYLDPRCRLRADETANDDRLAPWRERRFVVCMCGGGQDGFQLARAFLNASLPSQMGRIVLTGPCMPQSELAQLRELAAAPGSQVVWQFMPEADALIAMAERVVAMGGYNTLCSVLCHRKPALIIPRESPRREQTIRAERFHQLGLMDILPPAQASGEAISQWLRAKVAPPNIEHLDFSGLERIAALLEDVLSVPRRIDNGALSQTGSSRKEQQHVVT